MMVSVDIADPPPPTTAIDITGLRQAWRAVEAEAAAGNETRYKNALARLLTQTSAALKERAQ